MEGDMCECEGGDVGDDEMEGDMRECEREM